MRNYKKHTNRGSYGGQALRDALKAIENGGSLKGASRMFNVPAKTLRRHRDEKVRKPGHICMGRKPVLSSSFESDLVHHIQIMEKALFGLTPKDVRKLAYDLAERCGVDHSFNPDSKLAGMDWFYGFMKRHPTLSVRVPQATSLARAVGFNKPKVLQFFNVYEEELKRFSHFGPTNIWNVDETGIQNVQKPQPVVATKGARQVSRMTSAERGFNVTVVCAMSAAGQYVPPMFVFPRKRMNNLLLNGAPAGSIGGVSDSGWIDSSLFVDWLTHFCASVGCTPDRPHILMLDGHHSHKTLDAVLLARERGVILITLPPHSTHRMQPLDRTLFKSLKAEYNRAADSWMTTHPGKRIDVYQMAGLFSKAYNKAANVEKGVEGFRACGLWPFNKDVFQDEDFVAAEVTEEPAPTIEQNPDVGKKIQCSHIISGKDVFKAAD